MARSDGKKRRRPPRAKAPPVKLAEPLEFELRPSALLAVAAFGLYGLTAARTLAAGDSTELALVFAKFGVAHSPGYALQSLTSSLLTHLLFVLEPAFAANLLSALWASLATAMCFVALRELGVSRPAAAFAALSLAVGRTFWSQAVVAEVYTFDVLLLLGVLWSAARAFAAPSRGRAVLLGVLMASCVLHRSVNLLYLPGVVLIASAVGRPSFQTLTPGFLRGAALALLPLLYLPIAASFTPPLLSGELSTLKGVLGHITGSSFGHLLSFSPERALFRLTSFLKGLPLELGLALPLAVFCAYRALAEKPEQRRVVAGVALIVAANLAFASVYEIPDFEPYLLPSIVALALASAFGADALLRTLGLTELRTGQVALVASGALAVLFNFGPNDRSQERILRRMGEDVLAAVDPNALLLVQGDTVANVLLYLQYVEHRAPKVLVFYATLSQPWYHSHLRHLHPNEPWPPFDPNEPWPRRAATLIEVLGKKRPTYFTTELNPAFVLERGPLGKRWPEKYELLSAGLALALAPRGTAMAESATVRTLERLEASGREISGLSLDADIDSKITYLQYAAALSQVGVTLEHREPLLATRAYRAALKLEPDRYEAAYRAEQGARMGESIQPLGIAERAQVGLSRSERAQAELGGGH